MSFLKLAYYRTLLQRMHEKSAGIMLPVAIGAGVAAGIHGVGKTIQKAKQYNAGFYPGTYGNNGSQ